MDRIAERKVWSVKVTVKTESGMVFSIRTPVAAESKEEAEGKIWYLQPGYDALDLELLDVEAQEAHEVDLEEEDIDDFAEVFSDSDADVAPDEFERW